MQAGVFHVADFRLEPTGRNRYFTVAFEVPAGVDALVRASTSAGAPVP